MIEHLTIKQVFDEVFKDIVFDQKLCKKLHDLQVKFINKNDNHLSFFGSNLLGVYKVIFDERDFASFFDVFQNLDPDKIKKQIPFIYYFITHRNKKDEIYKVSGDPFNLTCAYVMHRLVTAENIPVTIRENAAKSVASYMFYRFFTSAVNNRYFQYQTDKQYALATYARLSNRYLIKIEKNWQGVFNYRANELINSVNNKKNDNIHIKTLTDFNDDDKIVYMISDCSRRIIDMLGEIYSVHLDVLKDKESIASKSSVMTDLEGQDVLIDKVGGYTNYINYLRDKVIDKRSFIKEEMITAVVDVIYTCDDQQLRTVLEFMSDEFMTEYNEDINNLIKYSIIVGFNYLTEHDYSIGGMRNIMTFLQKLRGCIITAKSNDENLIYLREISKDMVINAHGFIPEQSINSIKNAVFLYLNLRAYLKDNY